MICVNEVLHLILFDCLRISLNYAPFSNFCERLISLPWEITILDSFSAPSEVDVYKRLSLAAVNNHLAAGRGHIMLTTGTHHLWIAVVLSLDSNTS